eukprot:TRINITY_DN17847_c0_g1_i2.p2 TRINITY_DN17847_c0_g1~~TRINITY_DN17847_c0_g1_i2.p2  ORF type:complete len:100 (+),score=22.77 TRINITY_DN17847_c0_g1_i2:111-410(+)
MEVALEELSKEKSNIQSQLSQRLEAKKDTSIAEASELDVEAKGIAKKAISKSTLIPGCLASKSMNVQREDSPNKTAKSIEIERFSRRNSKIPGAILKKP